MTRRPEDLRFRSAMMMSTAAEVDEMSVTRITMTQCKNPPYKHTKIDTADLSDCALQGEWKPMGVAHGHLHVEGDNPHQVEVLQSVGSYAVPNKVIPFWQQNLAAGGSDSQDGAYNHKPSGLYSGGVGGSAHGYGSGAGFVESDIGGTQLASNHFHGGGGGLSGVNFGQKIKSPSMLSPPPIPPIILGKKPGYWKLPKTKHRFYPGKGRRPGFSSGGFGSAHLNHGGHGGGFLISGGSGHLGSGGPLGGSGGLGHKIKGGSTGGSISGGSGYSGYGFGEGSLSLSGNSGHGFGGGAPIIKGTIQGFGGGDGGSLSVSGGSSSLGHLNYGAGGGAVAEHLVAGSGVLSGDLGHGSGAEVEELSSGGHTLGGSSKYVSSEGGVGGSGHIISAQALGTGVGDSASAFLVHNSGSGVSNGHLITLNHGGSGGRDNLLPEATFVSNKFPGGGGHYPDSTFSSTHISHGHGGGNSLPDASFLSSHVNQDFAVHGQGISDNLSSSSTFTCGKNHDHNTNYHTATFQVADHDHPSSVDVLQYGGDAAVLIQSGDASFHDQILPERKHYKSSHLSDAEASGTDNRNELTSQAAQLTSNPTEQEAGQTEAEPAKTDDGDEPERHSYYHEITKVTKIPATSVGSVEYTFSKYETKPQTFSTESETTQDEPEVEQPQIIRELEHLSNKFQLDIENPQKLFEDPPSQELAYHYPFQDHQEHHQEGGNVESGKEEGLEGITEFPYQFYHNKVTQYPVVVNKKPVVKYIPRPGKPHFYQKTAVNYLQPKPPLVVLRKHKPKQFLKKVNYEVNEHSGERHRPVGEIFPPQKFPKQFHNPKPNFAVDRPKTGRRPDVYQEYHSHGKKIKKFQTKGKLVAPILIRRPVSPAPVIRVVEVAG